MNTKLVERNTENDISRAQIPMLEDAIYPAEFLSAFTSTAFKALRDHLERSGVPQEALALVDELSVITTWQGDLEQGCQVRWIANQTLLETVASASRNISAIGGQFYSPDGVTPRREGNDS
jgi:hypothetical protein